MKYVNLKEEEKTDAGRATRHAISHGTAHRVTHTYTEEKLIARARNQFYDFTATLQNEYGQHARNPLRVFSSTHRSPN